LEKAAKKMNKWADFKRRPREDDLLLVKLHFLFEVYAQGSTWSGRRPIVLKKEEEENVCKWPAYQHLRLELVALFIP
jgi:hypothetical protein